MLIKDFAERTRARIAEAREIMTKLREARGAAIKLLVKLDKQHSSDRDRLSNTLSRFADDVYDPLPEEPSEAEFEHASKLQDRLLELAGEVDEVSLASSSIEELGQMLNDTLRETASRLKEAEQLLVKVERLGARLKV